MRFRILAEFVKVLEIEIFLVSELSVKLCHHSLVSSLVFWIKPARTMHCHIGHLLFRGRMMRRRTAVNRLCVAPGTCADKIASGAIWEGCFHPLTPLDLRYGPKLDLDTFGRVTNQWGIQ